MSYECIFLYKLKIYNFYKRNLRETNGLDMYTTYHLTSAQELRTKISESIKATYKTKPISIIVEEDNSYPVLTNEEKRNS